MTRGRIVTVYLTVIAAMLVALSGASDLPLKIVYNASASAPLGWYAIDEAGEISVGDLVVVRQPLSAEALMVERGYIARDVPLVKFVMAMAGARICRQGDLVTINAHEVGDALPRDSRGRPLPRWDGCHVLTGGEVFLFNGDVRGSFDGRYFGPTPAADIIGKARPLWTW